MKRILALAVLLAPAAAFADDCREYGRGHGILINIVKRYWQSYTPRTPEDNTGLHASVLYWWRSDVEAGKSIARARLSEGKGGAECRDAQAAVEELSTAYSDVSAKIQAAWQPCTTLPTAQTAGACLAAVRPALQADKQARRQGGPLDKVLRAYQASSECLPISSEGGEGGSELDLFNRLTREPITRDARAAQIRIGKLRDARTVHLAKVRDAGVQPAIASVKDLLIKREANRCPPSPGEGAEHILFCLRDHPQSDSELLFIATSKVATARTLLDAVHPAGCPQ